MVFLNVFDMYSFIFCCLNNMWPSSCEPCASKLILVSRGAYCDHAYFFIDCLSICYQVPVPRNRYQVLVSGTKYLPETVGLDSLCGEVMLGPPEIYFIDFGQVVKD